MDITALVNALVDSDTDIDALTKAVQEEKNKRKKEAEDARLKAEKISEARADVLAALEDYIAVLDPNVEINDDIRKEMKKELQMLEKFITSGSLKIETKSDKNKKSTIMSYKSKDYKDIDDIINKFLIKWGLD